MLKERGFHPTGNGEPLKTFKQGNDIMGFYYMESTRAAIDSVDCEV